MLLSQGWLCPFREHLAMLGDIYWKSQQKVLPVVREQRAGVRDTTEHPTRWFLTWKNYLVQNVEMKVRKPKENVEGMMAQLNQNSFISVFIQGASVWMKDKQVFSQGCRKPLWGWECGSVSRVFAQHASIQEAVLETAEGQDHPYPWVRNMWVQGQPGIYGIHSPSPLPAPNKMKYDPKLNCTLGFGKCMTNYSQHQSGRRVHAWSWNRDNTSIGNLGSEQSELRDIYHIPNLTRRIHETYCGPPTPKGAGRSQGWPELVYSFLPRLPPCLKQEGNSMNRK